MVTSCAPDAEIAAAARRAFQQARRREQDARLLEARNHFAVAADECLELHRRGVRGPAASICNLGNAAASPIAGRRPSGHITSASRLDPNDHEIALEHLAFVAPTRRFIPRPEKDTPEARQLARLALSARPNVELAVIAGLAYVLAWIGGTFALFRRSDRLYLATVLAILAAIAFGIALWFTLEQADRDRRTPLVIVADNTPLYRGNGTSYPPHPDMPMLPRGMEVRQQHRRGNWLQVRLTSGEIGWVPMGVHAC